MTVLSANEFKNWEKNRYTLIHVLPQEHYQNLHIKGSRNICVYEVSFFKSIKKLNLDYEENIVLYGDSENDLDAKVAASKLSKLGFNNIYVLDGGLSVCKDILDVEGEGLQNDSDQLLVIDEGIYNLSEKSTIEWSGANVNGKHFGTIALKSGYIELKESLLNGEFIIDMNSIKALDLSIEDGSEYLESHLKSDDFFLSKVFPESKYSFKNIRPLEVPYQTDINYVIDGELTLRGITKEQKLNTLISRLQDGLVFNARVELDKTKWGVVYGSSKFFKFLGMHKIFDTIYLEMRLELIKES